MLQFLVIFSMVLPIIVSSNDEIVQKPENYITQKNIGIPEGSNKDDSVSTDRKPSVIGSSRGSQGHIAQQNIDIPGDLNIDSVSTNSKPSVIGSSRTSQGYIVQENVGMHGSPVFMTGDPMPLAVNSYHTIEYMDMSPTIMKESQSYAPQMRSTGGISSLGTVSMGSKPAARASAQSLPDYITQQNIGIPGSTIMNSGYGVGRSVIQLPVHSRHTVEYVDVPSTGSVQPVFIEVPASQHAVDLNFRSSSNIKVSQSHQSSPGSYQESHSEDEPIRLSHTLRRPIIQEVRESIQPIRKVTQEVRPVQEEIRTIIAVRGDKMRGKAIGGKIDSSSSISSGNEQTASDIIPSGYFGSGSSSGRGLNRGTKSKPLGWNASSSASSPIAYGSFSSHESSSSVGEQFRKQKASGSRRFYDGSYGVKQQRN